MNSLHVDDQSDHTSGQIDAWLEICLGLAGAPSLTEIESHLERAFALPCRPARWSITGNRPQDTSQANWQWGTQAARAADLTLPLNIAGRDIGSLELDLPPGEEMTPPVRKQLWHLTQSLAIGLHRIHLELLSLAQSAELDFVQALLWEQQPARFMETHNPYSDTMLRLLGGSSFEAIIPSSQTDEGSSVFSTRREGSTLPPKKRWQLMQLVQAISQTADGKPAPFYLAEVDQVKDLAEAYQLRYLSRFASLAIIPIHGLKSLLGALILGEERHPSRRPISRLAITACVQLAHTLSQTITRDAALRLQLDHGPFMRALIDQLDEGLVTVEHGKITSWNRAAAALFGYQAHEVLGKSFASVLHAAPPVLLDHSSSSLTDTEHQSVEWKLPTADGHGLLLECSMATLQHHLTGDPIVMYTFREVGRERELEHIKDELLSGISHELRTPLNNIIGFTRLLKDRPDLPESVRSESLSLVHSSTEQLNRMIEDFIDVARARRGHLPVALEPVDIGRLIRSIVDEIRPRFPQYTIIVRIARELPVIRADSLRITQIIQNLIGNAAAYSAEGTRIFVGVRRLDTAVAISVSDQGIGIAPEIQHRIFEPFFRAENSRRYRASGVGLGLSIVRSLVLAHGGHITLQSEVGKGTTFTCVLPASEIESLGE